MRDFFCFEASTLLEASPQEVFDFHQNPRNLSQIAPRTLKILDVKAGTEASVGERFEIRVSQFGIPIFWVGEWEMVQPNSALVDVGIRCPFAFWKHEHLFEPHGEHTRMTDRVQLTPKGGWFALQIGRPFLFLFLKKMFQDRHVATRRYFERKSKPGP